MESILYYISGDWNWLLMRLLWDEIDIDKNANTSKLRLRGVQCMTNTGKIAGQNMATNQLTLKVNGKAVKTFGLNEMTLTGGVPATWKNMSYDFAGSVVQTEALKHEDDGSLTVTVDLEGTWADTIYSVVADPQTVTIPYHGAGTGTIDSVDWGGGNWTLTNAGLKAFLRAAAGEIESGMFLTDRGYVQAKVTRKWLTDSNSRLAVTIQADETETPQIVRSCSLMDKNGSVMIVKQQEFNVPAGSRMMYYFSIRLIGR